MKVIKSMVHRFSEAGELIEFFWKLKMWFLIPFIIILLLFGILLVFAQSTGVAPFIYTLI